MTIAGSQEPDPNAIDIGGMVFPRFVPRFAAPGTVPSTKKSIMSIYLDGTHPGTVPAAQGTVPELMWEHWVLHPAKRSFESAASKLGRSFEWKMFHFALCGPMAKSGDVVETYISPID